MPRIFIAINLPPLKPLMEALGELRQMGRALRAVAPENLHITTRFLGEADASTIESVRSAISDAVEPHSAFDLKLCGVGVFPNERRPSVVWAGVDAESAQPLVAINNRLQPLLEDLGFAAESRPFQPHLTLARIKARPPGALRDFLDRYDSGDFGTMKVKSVDLMMSQLLPAGPQYSVLASFTL